MFRRFSPNFAILSIFLDSLFIILALVISNHFRPFLSSLPFAEEIQRSLVPGILYPVFAIIWVGIMFLFAVYDGRRNLYVVDEFSSLTLASGLAAISLAGLLYLSFRDVSRVLFVVFVIISYGSLLGWRVIARVFFRVQPHQKQVRRVLIVGAGPVGLELEVQINLRGYLGLDVVGFLDDDEVKLTQSPKILGPISHARRVAAQQNVDDVVIALPTRAYKRVNQLVSELHKLPIKVWLIPDYFHLSLNKAQVEEFAGLPMFDLRAPALNDYQRMVKRGFDLVTTFLLLIPILPVMTLIALAIRLDSPGPILFNQERVGENGKLFWMHKFRSMVDGADKRLHEVTRRTETGEIVHKFANDPRVTRVGRFLRRTSLDELPQIFNVLKGEMSLVGPRPELPLLVEQYEPWQHKRFSVPQGMTGWWQVNGRSDKPMHLNTEDDLFYIHNYSLLLDLQIILKTIWVVLRGKGAY
ncbi:MAG: sugar transferase [Anaerolineales bacterium]|nr:sugar transferase [Anaerolineales bacterium]